MASWGRSFRLHLKGGTVERDVDDEVAFHIETKTEELIEEGMAPAAAREEALRRFGDVAQIKRSCGEIGRRRQRGRRRTEVFGELWQDAVFAVRQLRKTPGFTFVAILTLALGVGATTAIFGGLYGVVLRPLPFPHAERLTHLWSLQKGDVISVSPGNFRRFEERLRSVEDLAAATNAGFTLTGEGAPEMVAGSRVTFRYFDAFGVKPALGRMFSAAEDRPGHERVAVLSNRLWRGRFGSDRGIVGRSILLNGLPHIVVGVMPADFDPVENAQLWVPLALTAEDDANYGHRYLRVMGRLAPGVTLAGAQSEAGAMDRQLEEAAPEFNKGAGTLLEPWVDGLLGSLKQRLLVLLGAVFCVLLIACVNVANLLLARGAARSREIAIRASLGAGRGRIVRQLLTENLVLGLAGSAAGLGLAYWILRGIVAAAPGNIPRLDQVRLDAPVLAFAVVLGLASSLLFGLVPAFRVARPDLQTMLKEGGRSLGTGGPRDRVRSGLMVAEVALALVLLAGAGLLLRSAVRLGQVELGFDPSRLLTARLLLHNSGEGDRERAVHTFERAVEEVGRVPGVESVAGASLLPLSTSNSSSSTAIEGHPVAPEEKMNANHRLVTPGYFRTLGVPLLAGRDLRPADREGSLRVVLVNQTLARQAWPGENALGKRLSLWTEEDDEPVWLEVVGVVGDIRQGRLSQDVRPEVYFPLAQVPPFIWDDEDVTFALVARTAGDPARPAADVRRAVLVADPTLPVFGVSTMEEIRASSLSLNRLNTMLLAGLGAIGLLLAAVGIYGVIAYFVAQRTQEIGLRMALGATERGVLRMVVLQALRPVAMGLVLGLAGAFAATRALENLLFGVSVSDPMTFVGVVCVLLAAALLASYGPARRAARVEPTRALAP
jgi:putative ABC transport system permease protein